jgi:hypothetical protein
MRTAVGLRGPPTLDSWWTLSATQVWTEGTSLAPRYPSAPPPSGYVAPLCTEREGPPPFVDCVPTSVIMMLDVWTQGEIRLTRAAVHAAANGHLTFPGVARALATLKNHDLRFSEAFNTNSTDAVSWSQLLDRISRGGAASVVGFYSRLVGHKGISGLDLVRWDRNLATSTTIRHAMAVSNYQVTSNRIWLQDPMGILPFNGEWIRPESLHAFIDKRGSGPNDRVTAACTPDPDRFAPAEERDVLNDHLKGMTLVPNRRAKVLAGATPRSQPAFDGHNPARFKISAPLTANSAAPLLGWVEGTNLTLADGTIVQRGTKWAALHNRVWGVFFVHEQDVGGLDPIETPD